MLYSFKLFIIPCLCFFHISTIFANEAPKTVKGATTINSTQAQNLYLQEDAIFIDIRPRNEWLWGHIDGAQHLGLKSTFSFLYHDGFINRNTPLIIYGNGSHEMKAALASYMAILWEYKNVFYYREGYFAWLALDLPIMTKHEMTSDILPDYN